LRLEQFRERRIALLNAARRTRDADGCHPGPDWQLTREESCASGCAAWLAIVVGKQNPLFGDTVNAGGSAHHAIRIGTHIPHADVVPENDEDVRSLPGRGSRALLRLCCWTECKRKNRGEQSRHDVSNDQLFHLVLLSNGVVQTARHQQC
jgi:hypothetical protein